MKTTQALLLLIATTVSCVTPAPQSGDSSPRPGATEEMRASQEDSTDKDVDPKGLAQEVGNLEGKYEEARLALEIGELAAAKDLAQVRRKGLQAERAVVIAREEWAHYRDAVSVLKQAKAQLGVDRAISRLESKRQDLQGILEIYEGEHEARAKDEIIRRNRKGVEFAQKALEQARMEARLVAEFEVPQKLEALQWELASAEATKDQSSDDMRLAEAKANLSLLKARHSVAEALQKLGKKRAKLEQLKQTEEAAQ